MIIFPNINFVKLLIIAGFNVNKINEICQRFHMITISANDFNEIKTTISKSALILQQINNNVENIAKQKPIKLCEEFDKREGNVKEKGYGGCGNINYK